MTPEDARALGLTFQLALVSTGVLLLLGTPLAWWLAGRRSWARMVVDALVALPLVLPPTVLGFYLLIVLGPRGPLAGVFDQLGVRSLAFTFTGLVIGSIVYSLPFVVRPMRDAFAAIDPRVLEAASTLRAGPFNRFVTVAVPLARRGFLTGGVLGLAHTMGEFGVVLMIGGSIPGETRVASIAIYEHVEALRYGDAHRLAAVLLVLSFALLLTVQIATRPQRNER